MENEYLNHRAEIKKITQRVKEYLWKELYLFKIRGQ